MATVTVVTGITIERQLLRVPAAWLIGDRYCADADAACCGSAGEGTVTVSCCANAIPQTLYLVISGTSCIDGVYPLTYNDPGYPGIWHYDTPDYPLYGISLTCSGSDFVLEFSYQRILGEYCYLSLTTADASLSLTCDPLSISGSGDVTIPGGGVTCACEGDAASILIVG